MLVDLVLVLLFLVVLGGDAALWFYLCLMLLLMDCVF